MICDRCESKAEIAPCKARILTDQAIPRTEKVIDCGDLCKDCRLVLIAIIKAFPAALPRTAPKRVLDGACQ